ncbi:MAG TPA: NUDIX hydrolase [Caldilineae bacterium]|nr:NUDIX hydrolase [Caldilineae bacterium]
MLSRSFRNRWYRLRSDLQAEFAALLMGILRVITLGQFPPVLSVGAIIVQDDQVLLLQRPDGRFTLPGGVVRYGETCLQALQREVEEETGLAVIAEDLQGIYADPRRAGRFHSVVVTYRCRPLSQTLRSSYEGSPLWVPLDRLPSQWSRMTGMMIQDFLEGRRRLG